MVVASAAAANGSTSSRRSVGSFVVRRRGRLGLGLHPWVNRATLWDASVAYAAFDAEGNEYE
jgi:hypothetical protein